ncbi:MAG TPA: hypothetical protein VKP88_08470 [Candidatus Paceibacterota bacterium]|nr:hypothetical protein [Candidatus Paceibacterota bacterium]
MENERAHHMYHSVLRVSALTLTGTLLFVSGVLVPETKVITVETEQYLANAISASAGVAPNEYNVITAALTEQEAALDEREAVLAERELALGLSSTPQRTVWDAEMVTAINSVLLFIVVVLMVINYTLDFGYRRQRVHNVVSQSV